MVLYGRAYTHSLYVARKYVIFFPYFYFIIVKRLLKGFSGLTVIFGDIFSVMTIVKRWLNPYGRCDENGKSVIGISGVWCVAKVFDDDRLSFTFCGRLMCVCPAKMVFK